MPTTVSELLSVETRAEILERFLNEAAILEIDVRGMQTERFARGYFEIESLSHEQWQLLRKTVVESGYLDSAEGSWLTLLAAGFFQVARTPASRTVGQLLFTDAQSVGPKNVAVDERVARSTGNVRFRNTTAGTIPLNSTVSLEIRAEVAGAAGNVSNNTITSLQTDIPGVTVNNPAYAAGTWITTPGRDEETDSALRQRCRDKWSSLGAGGNAAGYAFWITEAFEVLGLTPTITRHSIDTSNPFGPGSIGVYIANASGPATGDEVDIVDAYLQERKALGSGELRVEAAVAENVEVVAVLYQTGNANAVADAVDALTALQNSFDVGGTLYFDELTETLMGIDGVYDVNITSPAGNTVLDPTDVLVFSPAPVITLG